jgi:hypothetical protein
MALGETDEEAPDDRSSAVTKLRGINVARRDRNLRLIIISRKQTKCHVASDQRFSGELSQSVDSPVYAS